MNIKQLKEIIDKLPDMATVRVFNTKWDETDPCIEVYYSKDDGSFVIAPLSNYGVKND